MLKNELLEVILNFQDALKKKRLPDFNKNKHRAEQVLRILKMEYQNFDDYEEARLSDEGRAVWGKDFTSED
jgi:hypothetical protein